MTNPIDNWNDFVANPPDHTTFIGSFSDDFISKPFSYAIARHLTASADRCVNRDTSVGQLFQNLSKFNPCRKKDASIFCQGTVIEGRRSKTSMGAMSLIVLDYDKIDSINDIVEAVQNAGVAVAIPTSYSHMSTTSDAKWSDFEAWLGRPGTDASLEEVKKFFLDRGKHTSAIVTSISAAEYTRGVDGWVLRVTHAPVHKCRLIAVLEVPVNFDDYDDLNEGNEAWANAIIGFAAKLGIEIDESCTDCSRAFFSPSHPRGTNNHQIIYVAGDTVNFREVEEAGRVLTASSMPTDARPVNTTLTVEPKQRKQSTKPKENAHSGETTKLVDATKRWAKKYAKRFLIVDALAAHASDLLTTPAKGGKGRHLATCPFCERHSNPNRDTATYVCNASADPKHGFEIRCMHASCKDTDRLEFLQRLIDDGALPADALTDPRFLLEDPNAEMLEQISTEFLLPNNKGYYVYETY